MDLDIETLLHLNHAPLNEREESLQSFLKHPFVGDAVFGHGHGPCSSGTARDLEQDPGIKRDKTEDGNQERTMTVRGSDVGDLPTEYEIVGLKPDEIPVIGTYIDNKIIAGFRYRVRCLGNKKMLFSGQATTLQRIGMGYGKRITFHGPNQQSDYFYSDSHAYGYGFSLVAVEAGDRFNIISTADDRSMGTAQVEEVTAQQELFSRLTPDGGIEKHVLVNMVCGINYCADPNHLLSIWCEDSVEVRGIAILYRPKGASSAHRVCIEQLELPHLGACIFNELPRC